MEFIKPNDKPSNVIRRGANTSMALAIKSVKNHSNAIVSAGNTGALMAFSKLFLKTISGINRPAIAACFPTKQGEVCGITDCACKNGTKNIQYTRSKNPSV